MTHARMARNKPSQIAAVLQDHKAPPTPDEVKRFRTSSTRPIGMPGVHPGKAQDARPSDDHVFGSSKRKQAENVATLLTRDPAADQFRRPYPSEVQEPLGRGKAPLAPLPSDVMKETHRFGVSSKVGENAKDLVYPANVGQASPKKEPGFQSSRTYDWTSPKIDPTAHRFGSPMKPQAPLKLSDTDDTVVRSSLSGSAFKPLASPVKHGFAPELEVEHVYGKSVKPDEYRVNELLHGIGFDQNQDDGNLGKPTTKSPMKRKQIEMDKAQRDREGNSDADHIFGMPSIRTDKPTPKESKLTSNMNFGQDPGVSDLLYRGSSTGLVGQTLTLDAAVKLAERSALELSRQEVELCYKVACRNSRTEVPSAQEFLFAVNQAGF